jgi:hypothetical protein
MEGWGEWRRSRATARHSRVKAARAPARHDDDDDEFYAVVYVTAPPPAAAVTRKRADGWDDWLWLLPTGILAGAILITALAFAAGRASRGRHDAT